MIVIISYTSDISIQQYWKTIPIGFTLDIHQVFGTEQYIEDYP